MAEEKTEKKLEGEVVKICGLIGRRFTEEEKEALFKAHMNHVGDLIEDYEQFKRDSLARSRDHIRGYQFTTNYGGGAGAEA